MTIRELILSPYRVPVLTAALLLLTAHLELIFSSFRDGRGRRCRLLYVLHGLATFLCVYELPLMSQFSNAKDLSQPLRDVFTAICGLPAAGIVIYEALSALVLALCYWELYRYRANHPTFDSIKQTMDLLPVGISFGRPEDGTVVFVNRTMNDLARKLTGKGLNDLAVLRKICVEAPEGALALPDGSGVWQFRSQELEVDGKDFVQLTAEEITEQAAILRELERKHEKLLDIHRRLDLYNRQAERLVIAQELLTARMEVHNEVGNVLLESRHYLRDPASFDEARLLQALKYTNTYLLREYEEDDSARDALAEALEAAEVLGVDVSITGLIPTEEPFRGILAAAIRECAANAVKHANGDRLTAELREQDGGKVFFLCTNGTPPEGPIRETGGLLSLRALVDKERGSMRAEAGRDAKDAFRLTITLPG